MPPRLWRALALFATFAAVALLALVIAHWVWQIFGPPRVHIAPATLADPAATLLASGLWSAGAAPAAAPAADAVPQVLGGDVRLLGVFAESSGRGYALFRLPTGPRLVATGQTIAPGATLAAVWPHSISVREATGERSIALRGPAAKAPAAMKAAPIAKAATVKSACAPPAGFKGQVVALNAELMHGLIAQPESWRALVEPANGALVVRDESGFATMLGLKRGDRVEQANGIALTVPDDVIGAVLRPLAANQSVRVTGSRDGQLRELWLQNAGCT
jgi:hypothetical protein